MRCYTHVAMHNVVGALESLTEPIAPVGTTLRATGTTDHSAQGDARVTAQVSSQGQKRHLSVESAKENLRKKNGKALAVE
jgi:hypothetical protein